MRQFSLALIITLGFISLFFACKKESNTYLNIGKEELTTLSQPYKFDGETRKVSLKTDLKGIDVSSSEGWCSAYIERDNNGTTFLVIEVIKNDFSKEKTAEVRVLGTGGDITIPITQLGRNPSLEVNGGEKDTLFIIDDSLKFSLYITSNTDFKLELPSWIENVGDTPSVRVNKYDFEASATSPGRRNGLIKVLAQGHSDLNVEIPVLQIQHRLVNFYPTSAEKEDIVTLNGRDFGTDKSQVKVYFNTKEAEVVSVMNNSISVIVPRALDNLGTIKVVVSGEEEAYSQKFNYVKSWSLYTVTGGESGFFQGGTLADAILTPWAICVDDNNNIFVYIKDGRKTDYPIVRINETENIVEEVGTVSDEPYGLTVGANNIIYAINGTDGGKSYFKLDPTNNWVPEKHTVNFPNGTPSGTFGYTIEYNSKDGHLYETNNKGEIVKIDPNTDNGEVIFTNPAAPYWYGFSPDPDGQHLYAMGNSGAASSGRGFGPRKMDLSNPSAGFIALNSSAITPVAESEQELNDGALISAGFGRSRGMAFNKDGLLYVSDETNNLIRVINLTKSTVKTIIGVANSKDGVFGESGFVDGKKEKARLNKPNSLAWSKDGNTLYISDNGNFSIRKLIFD